MAARVRPTTRAYSWHRPTVLDFGADQFSSTSIWFRRVKFRNGLTTLRDEFNGLPNHCAYYLGDRLDGVAARSRYASASARFDMKGNTMMKRMRMILALAALVSALAGTAAEARGGGGGHMAGFGGGAHIGGGMGGMAHVGGFGGGARIGGGMVGAARIGGIDHFGGQHFGLGDHNHSYGSGLHDHGLHRFGRYWRGYGYDSGLDCYDWYYLHPNEPLPLSCG
jgi:hypothetical protein